MPTKDTQLKASQKYQSKFEQVKLLVPKGTRGIIQEYAKNNGESVNELILRLLREEIKELPRE